MQRTIQSLVSEPRPAGAPPRVGRDWYLVAAIGLSLIVEFLVKPEKFSLAESILLVAVLIASMLVRRTQPLLGVAASFGLVIVLNLVRIISNTTPTETFSAVWILILGYSLLRWASGREVVVGLGLIVTTMVLGTATSYTGVGDAIGSAIVLFFPCAVGATVRQQRIARLEQVERIKSEERAEFARELHDTVAHHVSAIAVSAQAGRFLAKSGSLVGATDALETIEEEASRTLTEMRSMIGLLRRVGPSIELAPSQGISDLDQLVPSGSLGSTRVELVRSGDLESVPNPVSTAVFRLAQESVTNAIRHATNATIIEVVVDAGPKTIRLTVTNNGDLTSEGTHPAGFGLVGMTERVELLGGTLTAGPGLKHGWVVRAEIPRTQRNQ